MSFTQDGRVCDRMTIIDSLKMSLSGTAAAGSILMTTGTDGYSTWKPFPRLLNDTQFGDASDGSVTFDGVTDCLSFSTRSGSTYTLTRCVYLASATVNSGVTVLGGGFRMFVNGILTNNGTISYAGNNASGATGGAARAANFIGGGSAGGNGALGLAGTAGSASTPNACGGAGGAGGAGTLAGGAAGSITVPTAATGGVRIVNALPYMTTLNNTSLTNPALRGGSGGGGGGGTSVLGTGGGGGGGGGALMIAAYQLDGNGLLTCAGGNGGSGSGAGKAGGGGGGGGGFLVVVTRINNFAGTLSVAGGVGGTGVNTGANGTAGTDGLLKQFTL